jgi:hypothetical protein
MRTQGKTTLGRRRFFSVLATGVAASALPLAGKARYKESEEVKTYYRVNRYPS